MLDQSIWQVDDQISFLSPQIVTVNCARLIKPDQHATNGIVHVVDRVITAISSNINTLLEVEDNLETLRVSTSADHGEMIRMWRSSTLMQVFSCWLPLLCCCALDGHGCCKSEHHAGERGSVHHLCSHQRRLWKDSSGDTEQDPRRPCGSERWPAGGALTLFVFLTDSCVHFYSNLVEVESDVSPSVCPPSDLLNYHILKNIQCAESIVSGTPMETLQGTTLEVGCDGDQMTLNGKAIVTKKDHLGTNGVIHYINELLIPDSGTEDNNFMLGILPLLHLILQYYCI